MQQLHAFWSQNTHKGAYSGEIAAGSFETVDEAQLDRVGADREDNRNGSGRCVCRKCRWEVDGNDHSHVPAHQFGRRKEGTKGRRISGDLVPVRNPITRCGSCARAAGIHAAAPTRTVMKSRRLIR
jgi:hypothetical protein